MTGHRVAELEHVFQTYCGTGRAISKRRELLKIYSWMNNYPKSRVMKDLVSIGVDKSTFYRNSVPAMSDLADRIQELDWPQRLDLYNHVPYFEEFFTGATDTLAVLVRTPKNRALQKVLHQPKYGSCVLKFQTIIAFLGFFTCLTGPHLGTMNDNLIFQETAELHPMHPFERLLADGAYISEDALLTPIRKPPLGLLSDEDLLFNCVLGHYRARVEHLNAVIKQHTIFAGWYRGSDEILADAMKLTVHTHNVRLKRSYRYPALGPWPHW